MEDKGFLSTSHYLQFDVQIEGDVNLKKTSRKEQDFNDLHKFLSFKYPNVLIPHVDKPVQDKKFSSDYMSSRAIGLTRFLNYCLMSEIIKQDDVFEKFLDAPSSKDFQKYLTKNQMVKEIKHLSSVYHIPTE